MTRKLPKPAIIIVWEFQIKRGKRLPFERAYGPDGDWVKLFRNSKGFIDTKLLPDQNAPLRYLTLDFWNSQRDYDAFKLQNSAAYKALDKKCASLTEKEKLIGIFQDASRRDWLPAAISKAVTQPDLSKIRPAIPADIPAIAVLEEGAYTAAHWPESAYREIFAPEAPARIALVLEAEDGAVRGFVIARQTGEDCELENIVIVQDRQRRGYGLKLMQALIAAARDRNAKRMFLDVRESNLNARVLYESSGFFISGRRKSYYTKPREDAVLYTLQL